MILLVYQSTWYIISKVTWEILEIMFWSFVWFKIVKIHLLKNGILVKGGNLHPSLINKQCRISSYIQGLRFIPWRKGRSKLNLWCLHTLQWYQTVSAKVFSLLRHTENRKDLHDFHFSTMKENVWFLLLLI